MPLAHYNLSVPQKVPAGFHYSDFEALTFDT